MSHRAESIAEILKIEDCKLKNCGCRSAPSFLITIEYHARHASRHSARGQVAADGFQVSENRGQDGDFINTNRNLKFYTRINHASGAWTGEIKSDLKFEAI